MTRGFTAANIAPWSFAEIQLLSLLDCGMLPSLSKKSSVALFENREGRHH